MTKKQMAKKQEFKKLEVTQIDGDVWRYVIEVNGRQFKDRFNVIGLEKKLKKLGTKTSLNYKIMAAVLSKIKGKTKQEETQDVQEDDPSDQ